MKTFSLILLAFVLTGCPNVDRSNFISAVPEDDKYTVVVVAPLGKPVPNAVVVLDYQGGMTDYAPPRFRADSTGRVSIPHAYAEKRGWEMLWVTGVIDGKEKRGIVPRGEVHWPQTVTLSESD